MLLIIEFCKRKVGSVDKYIHLTILRLELRLEINKLQFHLRFWAYLFASFFRYVFSDLRPRIPGRRRHCERLHGRLHARI